MGDAKPHTGPEQPAYLTVKEVSQLLRVSRWSVWRYIRAGLLVAVKAPGPNGAIRIPVASYEQFLRDRTVVPNHDRDSDEEALDGRQ